MGQALPDDAESLKRLVRDLFAERDLACQALKIKTLELEKLKLQLAKLRRMQFGRSSEKLAREVAQLELAIEEIDASVFVRDLVVPSGVTVLTDGDELVVKIMAPTVEPEVEPTEAEAEGEGEAVAAGEAEPAAEASDQESSGEDES